MLKWLASCYWPDNAEWSPIERASRRTFNAACLLGGVGAFAMLFFIFEEAVQSPEVLIGGVLLGVVDFSFPIFFRRLKSVRKLIGVLLAVIAAGLGYNSVTQGLYSPGALMLLPIALGIILMVGQRAGVVMFIYVIGVFVATYYVGRNAGLLDMPAIITLQFLCLAIVLILLFATVFVREVQTATEALAREKQNAKAADRAKSEFLANMSHEIRTPMNGVLGMAELLQETALDAKQKMYAQTMYSSGHALLVIINDILDFSKIEAGRLQLNPKPFDLAQTVEDVAVLLGVTAREKGVELMVRLHPTAPRAVVGDVGRLRQVIVNIAGNAIKFTDEGSVLIDLSGEERDGQGHIRITIEDTGVGVAADKLEKIFEKFEQADNASTRRYGGAGLGLNLSKSLVEMMGGKITAASEPGKGSVFTVSLTLPLADEKALAPPRSAAGRLPDNVSILVVDDNDVNRSILNESIQAWNARPVLAESAKAALRILRARAESGDAIPIALVDYHMPESDGLQLVEDIRKSDLFGDIKIIVLSSVDSEQVLRKARALKVVDTIVKPVRRDMLKQSICDALTDANIETLRKVAKEPLETTPESPSAATDATHKVLVVDDNLVNRMVVGNMLDGDEHAVSYAENGKQALEMATAERFDFIFMDIAMPVMDGVEASKEIRAMEKSKGRARTPIVALTAHAMDGDKERFLSGFIDDYLSKPAKKADILAMIAKWSSWPEKTAAGAGR